MTTIDRRALLRLHRAFELRMLQSPGRVPFSGWDHPFLNRDEIHYKHVIAGRAREALRWERWRPKDIGSGSILAAAREACSPSISKNLLEHRYGPTKGSARALHRVTEGQQSAALESALYSLMKGGGIERSEFGPRFEAFAEFLREQHLGCNWAFCAYLAFIFAPERYFPIRPGAFETLLSFLGVDIALSGHVTWAGYQTVLRTADQVREELLIFGRADTIQIQSYLWVLGSLVEEGGPPDGPEEELDFEEILRRRMARADAREARGLLGERFVFEIEKRRLTDAGRRDLAALVRLASETDGLSGYDVLSFEITDAPEPCERHIEVKSTTSNYLDDPGFFLTENERCTASADPLWTVARVWNVETAPEIRYLGNVVTNAGGAWTMAPDSWKVTRC